MSVHYTGENKYGYPAMDFSDRGEGLLASARRRSENIYSHIDTDKAIADGWNDGVKTIVKTMVVATPTILTTAAGVGAGAVIAYARLSGPEKAAVAAGAAVCYNQCCGGCVLQ